MAKKKKRENKTNKERQKKSKDRIIKMRSEIRDTWSPLADLSAFDTVSGDSADPTSAKTNKPTSSQNTKK